MTATNPPGSPARDQEIGESLSNLLERIEELEHQMGTFLQSQDGDNATFQNIVKRYDFVEADDDPTVTDIPEGRWGVFKNSTTGEIKIFANDGGVLVSTAAFT